jgi:predicted DNA-binding WGR domain protein
MVLAHLHRIDPDANMARYYCVDIALTLFGEVCVIRSWGRIGTQGRTSIETWVSAAEAEKAAVRTLRQKVRRGYMLTRPVCLRVMDFAPITHVRPAHLCRV